MLILFHDVRFTHCVFELLLSEKGHLVLDFHRHGSLRRISLQVDLIDSSIRPMSDQFVHLKRLKGNALEICIVFIESS